MLEQWAEAVNGVIWSNPVVYVCLGVGLLFSIMTRFLQIRHFKEMIRLVFKGKSSEAGVSSFQAFTMALSGRVGTGNIAGIALAVGMGGPGAIFWMWVMAFIGSATAFVESTLAQVYKVKRDGQYRGGPAFILKKGQALNGLPSFCGCCVGRDVFTDAGNSIELYCRSFS